MLDGVNRPDVPIDLVDRLRGICLALPDAYEEQAWTGVRWMVRKRTFAHIVRIASGWPPAYARAAGTDGPVSVLTFRSAGPELAALTHAGHPFFRPPWAPDVVGMLLDIDGHVDWTEIAELLTDSYCVLAPRSLVARVRRPAPDGCGNQIP
jgi:hypothetical protein